MWIYGTIVFLCSQTVHSEEKCKPGKYGDGCGQNCSQNCKPFPNSIVQCHKETGKCLEGCKVGVYGDLCDRPCSRNCKNHTCNQHNGHCSRGCIENHMGDFCETSQESTVVHQGTTYSSHTTVTTGEAPTGNSKIVIVIPVVVTILVLILVGFACAVIIFIWRIKKKKASACDPKVENGCIPDLPQHGQETDMNRQGHDLKEANLANVMKELQEIKDMMMSSRRPGAPQPSDSSVFYTTSEFLDTEATSGEGDTGKSLTPSRPDTGATPTPARRDARADADLRDACRKGNLAKVKRILDAGWTDVNSISVLGRTPVMVAALRGHRDGVELLVSEGADVLLVDDDGDNILHWACGGGDRKTVEFVLSLDGVDINSRGWRSWTPVMAAAWRGHRDVVEHLVSQGADVSLVDDDGDNILHLACVRGDKKTLEFVLALDGVDINIRGLGSWTPVMWAALWGHTDVVELLVSQGADMSLVDDGGNNLLHYACMGGDRNIVKFVLSFKVLDINVRNNTGQTAVDVARHEGHTNVVKLLEPSRCHLM